MNLLGHSFGGYLSAAYALRHPDRVHHLILVDAWGFLERPPDFESKRRIPWYFKALFHIFKHFNPLAVVRDQIQWQRTLGPNGTKTRCYDIPARKCLQKKIISYLNSESPFR